MVDISSRSSFALLISVVFGVVFFGCPSTMKVTAFCIRLHGSEFLFSE